MRNSAAIEQRGRVKRFIARIGATTLALIGHLAVLFALGYEPTSEKVVDEPPAAIAVEIVVAAPAHSEMASLQPDAIDGQDTTKAIESEPTKAIAQPQQEPGPTPAAFAAPMPTIVPMPVRKPSSGPAKIGERQTSPVKRRSAPLALAPTSDPSVFESSADGFAGTVGAGTASSDVPSTWKVRLMSHLDRYKRYPEAARARHVEGTALLSFGMDRDGRVLGYYIVRSSGCPELDNEVLAMIERASPLPPAPPEIRQQIVQLVVPVRFRM